MTLFSLSNDVLRTVYGSRRPIAFDAPDKDHSFRMRSPQGRYDGLDHVGNGTLAGFALRTQGIKLQSYLQTGGELETHS
jgi:hypothetical protein